MPQCPGALPDANQGTLMLATSFGFLLFRLLLLMVVACAGAGASSPVHSHPSASMLPTLPDRARHDRSHVVGLPGDRVQMIKGRLSGNGESAAMEPLPGAVAAAATPCGPIANTSLAAPANASSRQMAAAFPTWASRLGDDHVLELATLSAISDTALTRQAEFQMTAAGLPNTFVPGRNLLFFTYAAALAYRRGIRTLVGGMCETDVSGYPDCRNDTLQTLAKAISLGMEAPFTIETPLMRIDKAGTWAMAQRLGGTPLVDLIVEHTHSCYTPERTTRWAWGYGCGGCPACGLRQRGWEKWQTGKT